MSMYLGLHPQVMDVPVVLQPAKLLVGKSGVHNGKDALEPLV